MNPQPEELIMSKQKLYGDDKDAPSYPDPHGPDGDGSQQG